MFGVGCSPYATGLLFFETFNCLEIWKISVPEFPYELKCYSYIRAHCGGGGSGVGQKFVCLIPMLIFYDARARTTVRKRKSILIW